MTVRQSRARASLGQLVFIFAVGIYGTNVAYLFVGSLEPVKSYAYLPQAVTEYLGPPERSTFGGAVARTVLVIPVPLPWDYVKGACEVSETMQYRHECYLRGAWQRGGWWYYYLYGLGAKTTLGAMGVLALAVFVRIGTARNNGLSLAEEVLLLLPALAILFFVTMLSGCHHHMRYALPAVPFVFIYAGQAARGCRRFGKAFAVPFCGCLLASIVGSLACYPHSISYFNELAGGPQRGDERLVDSNFDWGRICCT